MTAKVTFTVVRGVNPGDTYTFDSRTTCIVGRHVDCQMRVADDREHATVSRFHCLLDINPPGVQVRDYGSLNGTYLNDRQIGQRPAGMSAEDGRKLMFPAVPLQDGDRLSVGNTVWQVSIEQWSPDIISIPPPIVPPNAGENGLWQMFQQLLGKKDVARNVGNYELIRRLGKGGCGEVFLARDRRNGAEVALKLMLPQYATNQTLIKLFLREISYSQLLNHPHVIEIADCGEVEGVFFLTMEYCNRGSVQDLIDRSGGRLGVDVAVPMILQVLDGLEYAHNLPYKIELPDGTYKSVRGIVHRDLKPANFFLHYQDGNTLAKVGDYGLAKSFDFAGLSGFSRSGDPAMGTFAFMPRQQVKNFKYVQPDVDVWATAASLYYMLTGELVRDFERARDPDLAVLTEPVIPILERRGDLPRGLAATIDRALQEEPRIYYQSAGDFRRALFGG